MKRLEISESSNIEVAMYDKEYKKLEVTFNNGRTYVYSSVPMEVAQAFEEADSAGRFLRSEIIPNYNAVEKQ